MNSQANAGTTKRGHTPWIALLLLVPIVTALLPALEGQSPATSFAQSIQGGGSVLTRIWWVITLSIVMYQVFIFIHECGHVAAALAAGMRVGEVVAGPLRWARGADHFQLGFHTEFRLFFMGLTIAVPVGSARNLRGRVIALVLGGPGLAALASAALVAYALIWEGSPRWREAWLLCATVGWGNVLLNLIPYKYGDFETDGLIARALWRREDTASQRWLHMYVMQAGLDGRAPGIPASEYLRLRQFDDPAAPIMTYLGLLYGLAEEEHSVARELLRDMRIDQVPPPMGPALEAFAIGFYSFVDVDAAKAAKLLNDRIRTSPHLAREVPLLTACVHCAAGEISDARIQFERIGTDAATASWLEPMRWMTEAVRERVNADSGSHRASAINA